MVTSSMHALQYRRREGGGGLKIKNTFKTEFQTFREKSCSERGELKPMRSPNTFLWIHIITVVLLLLQIYPTRYFVRVSLIQRYL